MAVSMPPLQARLDVSGPDVARKPYPIKAETAAPAAAPQARLDVFGNKPQVDVGALFGSRPSGANKSEAQVALDQTFLNGILDQTKQIFSGPNPAENKAAFKALAERILQDPNIPDDVKMIARNRLQRYVPDELEGDCKAILGGIRSSSGPSNVSLDQLRQTYDRALDKPTPRPTANDVGLMDKPTPRPTANEVGLMNRPATPQPNVSQLGNAFQSSGSKLTGVHEQFRADVAKTVQGLWSGTMPGATPEEQVQNSYRRAAKVVDFAAAVLKNPMVSPDVKRAVIEEAINNCPDLGDFKKAIASSLAQKSGNSFKAEPQIVNGRVQFELQPTTTRITEQVVGDRQLAETMQNEMTYRGLLRRLN